MKETETQAAKCLLALRKVGRDTAKKRIRMRSVEELLLCYEKREAMHPKEVEKLVGALNKRLRKKKH